MKKIIIAALAVMMILAGCNNSTPAPSDDQMKAVISVIGALSQSQQITEAMVTDDNSMTIKVDNISEVSTPGDATTGIPASTVTGGKIDISATMEMQLAEGVTNPEGPEDIIGMTITVTSSSAVKAKISPEGSESYDTELKLEGKTTINNNEIIEKIQDIISSGNTPTKDQIVEIINAVDFGELTLSMGSDTFNIKDVILKVIEMMPEEETPAPEPAV